MTFDKIKPYLHWLTLAGLILIVGIADPGFLHPVNLLNIFGDVVPLMIMALGITFTIYIGGIDLSSQSVANMTTVIVCLTLPIMGFYSLLLCLVVGFTGGIVSGFVTTRFFVPSFITTLAIGGVAMSAGDWLSGQRALYMDAELREKYYLWMIEKTGIVPNELIIAVVLVGLLWVLLRRTPFGRALKSVGAGELAAVASGINVARIKIIAFGISGMLAALAGVIFAVKLSGGSPTIANGFLLLAIVSVLVGGTPLTGGVGGVVNTLVGAMIVAVIRASMLYFEVDATHQQMVFGVILIVAIALTIDRTKLKIVK